MESKHNTTQHNTTQHSDQELRHTVVRRENDEMWREDQKERFYCVVCWRRRDSSTTRGRPAVIPSRDTRATHGRCERRAHLLW